MRLKEPIIGCYAFKKYPHRNYIVYIKRVWKNEYDECWIEGTNINNNLVGFVSYDKQIRCNDKCCFYDNLQELVDDHFGDLI